MNDENGKLYYVDSIEMVDKGESFLVRLLSQENYSFKAKQKYVKVASNLIDKKLIDYYRKNKDTEFNLDFIGGDNGFYEGAFVRLNEKAKQLNNEGLMFLSQDDLRTKNIEFYTSESQQDNLPELKVQKYEKKPSLDWNIPLIPYSKLKKGRLYCFKVGQGDMSLFISEEGHVFVIDTHITNDNKNNILKMLKRFLRNRPIDALILTHRHIDHYAGAYLLLKDPNIEVKSIIVNESFMKGKQPNQIDKLLNEADRMGCVVCMPSSLTIPDGDTTIYFSFHNGNVDENDNSILIQIYDKNKLYYLTGDMGVKTLEGEKLTQLFEKVILKVSHHGSDTGTSCRFLRKFCSNHSQTLNGMCEQCECLNSFFAGQILDKHAFISVGYNNRYKHPHFETIPKLECIGFKVQKSRKLNGLYRKY